MPECCVDTNLIETLVPEAGGFNHQSGCGTVTQVMQKKLQDDFALGIIDKDKYSVDYLKQFDLIHEAEDLYFYKHPNRHHFIIQISPAIERFILKAAEQAGVNVTAFGLPDDFEKFKRASKTVTSKTDDRFKRLFKAIRKQDIPVFNKLTAWVRYLNSHPYNFDIDDFMEL